MVRPTLVACVALMAAGVVVASRAGDPNETTRGAGTVVSTDDGSNWYLPTDLPVGYELTGIAA